LPLRAPWRRPLAARLRPRPSHRLASFDIAWQEITHIALTHFHPDHFADLPLLVYALKYTAVPARHEPLVVLGPRGVVRLMRSLSDGYGAWLLDPGFPILIMDVQPGEPFPLDAELTLDSFPVPHTAESVALGLTAPEGRLVYTGDTGPSPELARWARGCDLLLAECSLPESMAMEIHLTPHQAGDLAREAEARRLVLTHFYPPVEDSDPARAAATRYGGPVTAAADGDRFTI
jgi:ribonuclease BN (tRNA processing enzyme)